MLTITQLFVLLAVDTLRDKSHGVNVGRFVANYTSKPESFERSVYATLHRLHELGLVNKWIGGQETPRPYYQLTPSGADAVIATLKDIQSMSEMASKTIATLKRKKRAHGKASRHQGHQRRAHHGPAGAYR